MKVFDFIKQLFEKNQIKQSNNFVYEDSWREMLHYEPSDDDEEESLAQTTLTEEQIRAEQIKSINFMVLTKDSALKKEDIVEYIQKKYENVVLNDIDMQSLISIYHAIEYEDAYGNYNIREFIDEDDENIVKLVDGLISNAKEEAKKYKSEDVSKFVTTDNKVINEIKNEIERNIDEEERCK